MSSVEERLAALEQQVQRLNDEKEINQLMGRYDHNQTQTHPSLKMQSLKSSRHTINHLAKNMHKTLSFFALDEPDVCVEVGDRGVYRGRAALETLFQAQFGSAALKGNLLFAFLTTGMVEIAKDGKTAKGTWRSPSVQAVMPKDGNGEPSPVWLFGAYAGVFFLFLFSRGSRTN
jgi:hypothetical protein